MRTTAARTPPLLDLQSLRRNAEALQAKVEALAVAQREREVDLA